MNVIATGTETKVFGEPKLPDSTLARLGRNEGVRKMQTAERITASEQRQQSLRDWKKKLGA